MVLPSKLNDFNVLLLVLNSGHGPLLTRSLSSRLLLKNKKSFFSVFCPHTLTFRFNLLIFSYKPCEGRCEGRIFALTLAITGAERCLFILIDLL